MIELGRESWLAGADVEAWLARLKAVVGAGVGCAWRLRARSRPNLLPLPLAASADFHPHRCLVTD